MSIYGSLYFNKIIHNWIVNGVFMSNIVYKDNNLIEASYALTLTEQRIILLSIIIARDMEQNFSSDTPVTVPASMYMEKFRVERQTAYEALQTACDTLFERRLSFESTQAETGQKAFYKSRWVSKVGYLKDAACVQLTFAPDIVPLFMSLEKRFTRYELKQIADLSSVYSIRLYELLIRWRSTGFVTIRVEALREKLGVLEGQYKTMGDFKKRVLDNAVQQINKHTDILVHYEQIKDGRVIKEFQFYFEVKKIKEVKAIKPKYELSAKQQQHFANLLCDSLNNHEFCAAFAHTGESMSDFRDRIQAELAQTKYVEQYYPYLLAVGFKDRN